MIQPKWPIRIGGIFLLAIASSCSEAPLYGALNIERGTGLPEASRTISITSWNVGYGALGENADFIADGGDSLRALERDEILTATDAIAEQVADFETQFIFFQELAQANFLTRGVPLLQSIDDNLQDYSAVYWEDLRVRTISTNLSISHGMGVYSRNDTEISHAYELPQEPGYYFLFAKRFYAAIVNEVPIRGSNNKWVLINIHLSAFDDDANVRRNQITAVFDFARDEFAKGNYVVIGGDWNMRLSDREFSHNTSDEYLFWVHDFPNEMLPEGWNFAVDESVPTVRTLHEPYVAGQNFTMIIDGFAYSPNVALQNVSTIDLAFEYSDHNPVMASFRAR